jgi:fructan beta-fructosidase
MGNKNYLYFINKMKNTLTLLIALLLAPLAALHAADKPAQPARPDIVIADFEQGYGDWIVKGEAFNHPTTPVSGAKGFAGKGLADSSDKNRNVNSGSLTSPEFTIERRFIRFLVGGRGFDANTSLQLFVDGKIEFYACGIGDQELRAGAFDVSSFQGQKARLVICDEGMWHNILVDELVAGDSPGKETPVFQPRSQCIPVDKEMNLTGMHYLILPINNRAPMVQCMIEVDGKPVQDIAARLAIDEPVDFLASYPLGDWKGRRLRLRSIEEREQGRLHRAADGSVYFEKPTLNWKELSAEALDRVIPAPVLTKERSNAFLSLISLSTEPRDMAKIYREPGRPQLMFTPKRGFNMDPSGMYYYNGLYHIFYNTNPVGLEQGNNQWGHATSPDLFHWTEQPIGIPPGLGWRVYSGNGVVDVNNYSGLKQGVHPPILLFYSQDGRAATALNYSVDGGKTFREYVKNPLFQTRHPWGHDPKVAWYEPEKKWVMVIHDFADERNERWGYDFYESKNLLDWKYLSTTPNCWETPDFFRLPLDEDRAQMRWVLHECGSQYQIGDFNGREFVSTTAKQQTFMGNCLAPYTFDNAPEGRRIQVGATPGFNYYSNDPSLPVNGGITIPMEVTLRTSLTGPRLYLNPVKEIEKLVFKKHDFKSIPLGELAPKLTGLKPDLFDIEFEWDAAQQKDFQLNIWDRKLFAFNAKDMTYSVDGQKRKVTPVKGSIKIRLICDRSVCSFFINDGYEAGNRYLAGFRPECKQALSLQGDTGTVFMTFQIRALRPTWKTTQKHTTY